MITDPNEIELLSAIEQQDYRVAEVGRDAFEHIYEDFLSDVKFAGARFLDLGVGHFDFGEMARARGANTWAVDYDPAVVALGRRKRFPVLQANLEHVTRRDFDIQFDGILCKYSCNAFTFADDLAALRRRPLELLEMMQPSAWAWIAPWNGRTSFVEHLDASRIQEVLDCQIDAFKRAGFLVFELPVPVSAYYGVNGCTENRPLFIRNLPVPDRLSQSFDRTTV